MTYYIVSIYTYNKTMSQRCLYVKDTCENPLLGSFVDVIDPKQFFNFLIFYLFVCTFADANPRNGLTELSKVLIVVFSLLFCDY